MGVVSIKVTILINDMTHISRLLAPGYLDTIGARFARHSAQRVPGVIMHSLLCNVQSKGGDQHPEKERHDRDHDHLNASLVHDVRGKAGDGGVRREEAGVLHL